MTLQEIVQILGGVGVIASMIYVGIQIRNNARAVRAATYQQLSVNTVNGWLNLGHDGDTTDILLRGRDDFFALSPVESARFRFLASSKRISHPTPPLAEWACSRRSLHVRSLADQR